VGQLLLRTSLILLDAGERGLLAGHTRGEVIRMRQLPTSSKTAKQSILKIQDSGFERQKAALTPCFTWLFSQPTLAEVSKISVQVSPAGRSGSAICYQMLPACKDGGLEVIENGGPGQDRTADLFHVMEMPSAPVGDGKGLTGLNKSSKPAELPLFATNLLPNLRLGQRLICGGSDAFLGYPPFGRTTILHLWEALSREGDLRIDPLPKSDLALTGNPVPRKGRLKASSNNDDFSSPV
jgi:hypothetical protein